MQTSSNKLIVLRGNSGSGKSTVAQQLRKFTDRKVAWIEQDYIRRKILKEKEADDGIRIALISEIVTFTITHGYDVILEGILSFSIYGTMLKEIRELCPEHYFFYFDIPFEETLKRHETKPNTNEFGKKEMEEWFKPHDITGFPREIIISDKLSLDATVQLIAETTGLTPLSERIE